MLAHGREKEGGVARLSPAMGGNRIAITPRNISAQDIVRVSRRAAVVVDCCGVKSKRGRQDASRYQVKWL